MTDRKLPVIYVRVTSDKSSILTNPDDEIELVDPPFLCALDASVEECTVVPYEQMAPRCKTCEQWAQHKAADGRDLMYCVSTWLPKEPGDYCSCHSELRK